MKISCPKCQAGGTIADHDVPEAGRFISCPRCHEGFTVTKPRSGKDDYLVDTCPACSFSTFGDETFSTCPKCGLSVKTFIERQREEQLLKRNQELLGKKRTCMETLPPPPPEPIATPVADFVDGLHPVNLISWGVSAAAIIIIGFGLWGIVGYDSAKIQAQLMEERDEQLSGLHVFLQYGLLHWCMLLYGVGALAVSQLFMKRLKNGLRAMSCLLWVTIFLVPLSYLISFIDWVLAPIPHTFSGYMIETLNVVFMSALVGIPLFMLERFLHERKITSVVKL